MHDTYTKIIHKYFPETLKYNATLPTSFRYASSAGNQTSTKIFGFIFAAQQAPYTKVK
jgi:hypothetical protein